MSNNIVKTTNLLSAPTGDLESEPRQTSAPVRIINEIDNKQYEQKIKCEK